MQQIESTFIKRYVSEMVQNIKLLRPKLKKSEIKEIIIETLSENLILENPEQITIVNNYKRTEKQSDLLSLIDFYLDEKPIMSGYGTMFKRHDKAMNLNAAFVDWLLKDRKVYKKIQFEGLENNDKRKEAFGFMMQKTVKLLNNSYYGVTSEKNSQFFNEILGPSITYTGYQIITSSILGFEMLLSNNIHYDNFTDLSIYINRILRDRHKLEVSILDIIDEDKIPTPNDVYKNLKFLTDYKLNKDELKEVKNILRKLSKEDLACLYYTNNLFEFLKNSRPKTLLGLILDQQIQDPAEINEDTKNVVGMLFELIKKYVVYDYQVFNRAERALTMERESILTINLYRS